MDNVLKMWFIILLLPPSEMGAQENKLVTPLKRNTIFLEVGGQSLYASVSYDRLFRVDKKIKTSVSSGLAILPLKGYFFISVPTSFNVIFGQKNHHLELGAGMTVLSESYNDRTYNLLYFSPKIAYRFQRPIGGPFARVSFVPIMLGAENYSFTHSVYFYHNSIIYNPDNDGLYWWFGLSAGWTFK